MSARTLSRWWRREYWLSVIVVAAGLAVWEWKARSGALSSLFFPAPSEIARTFVALLKNGELTANVLATMKRVALGFLLGGSVGLSIGLAMGWSERLRAAIDPFVAALHPIPKIAILPLFMILFGIGEQSKVMVVSIAVFFPMVINATAGARAIHPIHFEVARNFGAGPITIFTNVVLPGALPTVLAGARLAINIALLITIAIELLLVQTGLGKMIWFAWQTMRTEELYVSLFVTAGLGIGLNVCLEALRRWVVPWQMR